MVIYGVLLVGWLVGWYVGFIIFKLIQIVSFAEILHKKDLIEVIHDHPTPQHITILQYSASIQNLQIIAEKKIPIVT